MTLRNLDLYRQVELAQPTPATPVAQQVSESVRPCAHGLSILGIEGVPDYIRGNWTYAIAGTDFLPVAGAT